MKTQKTKWTCAITITFLVIVCVSPSHAYPPVKQAGKILGELIYWLSDAKKLGKVADESAELLSETAKRMRAVGDDLHPRLFSYIKKNFNDIPTGVYRDDVLLKFLSQQPDLIESTMRVAEKCPITRLGTTLETIARESPKDFEKAISHLGTAGFKGEQAGFFFKAVGGKPTSQKQIGEVVDAFRNSGVGGGNLAGEMFEVMARQQLAQGTMRIKAGCKPFCRVVSGQHNAIHGIDGISIAVDGKPILFEFTIDANKNLQKTGQLSPEWCKTRWNLLHAKRPEVLDELVKAGMDPKYAKAWSLTEAKEVPKKLVASTQACLTDANRIAVGLKPEDLFLLGN